MAALARSCRARVAADRGRQAASLVVVGRMRGAERCRRTISVASCGWHLKQQVAEAWHQWQVAKSSPRAMTAGGRAMLPTLGAALQQQIWHRSLPPPLLPMPAARWRSALASSDFLNHFVRFGDLLAEQRSAYRLEAADAAQSMGMAVRPCALSERKCRIRRRSCAVQPRGKRASCVKASIQSLLYIT